MQGNMNRLVLGFGLIASLLVALLVSASSALALDRIHLKNGKVVEGEITSETEEYIFINVMIGSLVRSELITVDTIDRIERDVRAAGDAVAGKTGPIPLERKLPEPVEASPSAAASKPRAGGPSRVCFISLEEMVGTHLNADALKHSVEIARAENPDIIVLVVNSGGGFLLEVQPLSDYIHKEMKKDFRVVGWIQSAISAASMTVWNCEEIYMMPEGNVGGSVAFSQQEGGQTKALEGVELEAVLKLGEELSRRGKRNPLIMRAMQIFMDLSADIDENGDVTWHEGTSGQFLVSAKNRILTLNSHEAERFKVSKGTAATKEELLRLMGVREWVEVAPKADAYQREFRANVTRFAALAQRILGEYQLAVSAANGAGGDEKLRNMYIGRARSKLQELQSAVRRAPSYEKYSQFNKEWFEERFEELRKMARGNR